MCTEDYVTVILVCLLAACKLLTEKLNITSDECQNKYGNANAWRYCCRVFDLLTVAAVSLKQCWCKFCIILFNFTFADY